MKTSVSRSHFNKVAGFQSGTLLREKRDVDAVVFPRVLQKLLKHLVL